MKLIYLVVLVVLLAVPVSAQTKTYARGSVPTFTVATLPATGGINQLYKVTDSLAGTCATGGGSLHVLCQWNGSAYEAIGPGAAGGGAFADITGLPSDNAALQSALDAKQSTSGKDATGGYVGLTGFKINFKNAANTFTSFLQNTNTAARTYTFQDRDGTIADDTDLATKQGTLTNSAGLRAALSDESGTGPALFDGATTPTFTSPRIITDISDSNGNEVFKITATPSAVNEFTFSNQATGGGSANGPTIKSTGGDASVDFNFDTQGTGARYQWKINGVTKMDYTDVGGGFQLRELSGGGLLAGGVTLNGNKVSINSDVALGRAAAGVMRVTDSGGGNTNGWFQQTAGRCFLAADQTNNTTTMANVAGCAPTVTSGRKYAFKLVGYFANSTASDGAKLDFDGGTATMTNFRCHCTVFDTALGLSLQTSALATDFTAATLTGDALAECHGTFEPSGTGTFIPRVAMVTAIAGTLTAYRGSHLLITDMP